MTATCNTCPHFYKLENQCRAEPPKFVATPTPDGLQLNGIWPPTREHEWCGYHPDRKFLNVLRG